MPRFFTLPVLSLPRGARPIDGPRALHDLNGIRIRLQVRNEPGILRALADHLKSMGLPKGSVMTYSRLDQTKRIVF